MAESEKQSSPSRQQRRVAKTRQRLLEAARAVFAEKGMDLTRIGEITNRADVGKGTFYYHFKGKDQLVRALIRDLLVELAAATEQRCRGAASLKELLDALIGAHIEFFCTRWEDFVLYVQSRSDLTIDESYEGLDTPFMEYFVRMEALLASVIRRSLPKPVLRRVSCAVIGFVSGYYSFAVIASQGEDVDSAFRSLRGAMVESLARFIEEATPE